MKITWLGQAGLLFETADTKIIIDPYLSDSCNKVNPKLWRRYQVDESFLKIKPDVLILTHSHLDHTDPETLEHYLNNDEKVTVLASFNAWEKARAFKGNHNYVMFNNGTRFTQNGITFKSVYAEHSDFYAIGVIFEAEGKTYYVTGDTLYNEKVFKEIDQKIDAVFLPINGVGNNMNAIDAEDFAKRIGANGETAYSYFIERIGENGLFILDEPENSLSPKRQIELKSFIENSVRFFGCQFIISTHSPFLLALQGAKIYDLDEKPAITKKWTELENVKLYREFFKMNDHEFNDNNLR